MIQHVATGATVIRYCWRFRARCHNGARSGVILPAANMRSSIDWKLRYRAGEFNPVLVFGDLVSFVSSAFCLRVAVFGLHEMVLWGGV